MITAITMEKFADLTTDPNSYYREAESYTLKNLTELIQSIKMIGVKNPLEGYRQENGTIVIFHGLRRYHALSHLPEKALIPIRLVEEKSKFDILITRINVKALRYSEYPKAIACLKGSGLTENEIRGRLGLLPTYW